jgi:hypothetical protein
MDARERRWQAAKQGAKLAQARFPFCRNPKSKCSAVSVVLSLARAAVSITGLLIISITDYGTNYHYYYSASNLAKKFLNTSNSPSIKVSTPLQTAVSPPQEIGPRTTLYCIRSASE